MPRFGRWVLVLALTAVTATLTPAVADPPVKGPPHANQLTTVVPVRWEGQTWLGRVSPFARQGPNENYWLASPQRTFTDDRGRLHLVADKCGGNWCGAGIATVKDDYGYGTYRFSLETPLGQLDPTAVVGMFTYNRDVVPGRQEADVELSRWGHRSPTARNAQWVVQPWTWDGHLIPFTVPRAKSLTYQFTWLPGAVKFRAWVTGHRHGRSFHPWTARFQQPGAPQRGTEVHLNLWFLKGQPPYDRKRQEVVFRDFVYKPLSVPAA